LYLVRHMRNFRVIAIVCIASQSYAGIEHSFVCRHCGLKGTFVQGALLTANQCAAQAIARVSAAFRPDAV